MIVIVPVFFDGDESFWRDGPNGPLLAHVLDVFGRAESMLDVFVVTDASWVAELARQYGLKVLIAQRAEAHESRFLPYGTAQAVQAVEPHADIAEGVLVVGFRNIPTGLDVVNRIAKEVGEIAPEAGISVVKSIDHPCQIKTYNRFGDTFLLHVFDDSNRARAIKEAFLGTGLGERWEVSRPIFFNWKLKGVKGTEPGTFFRRKYNGMHVEYECIRPGSEVHGKGPVWFMEAESRARVIVPNNVQGKGEENPKARRVGCTVSDREDAPVSSLYRGEGGVYTLQLDLGENAPEFVSLKLMPLGPEGPRGGELCDYAIGQLRNQIKLPVLGEDLCGLVVSVFEEVCDGPYDMSDVYKPSENLWLVNNASSEAYLPDGTPIVGRQAFPDMFEPDGSFFALSSADVTRFDVLVDTGKAQGLHLNESDTVRIDSDFDVLRWKAALEVKSTC